MKIDVHCGGAPVRAGRTFTFAAALALVLAVRVGAQDFGAQGRASNQPPANMQAPTAKTPRAAAPKDFTGYWVSVVTELWRYRMIVPDKNDYEYVPLNPEGRKLADTWDPAKDQ